MANSLEQALGSDPVSKYAIMKEVELTSDLLRRRRIVGSHKTAEQVARLLRKVVSNAKVTSFEQLVRHIEMIGEKLQRSAVRELVITSVTQRVIKFLEEEYSTALEGFIKASTSDTPNSSSTPQSASGTPISGTPGLNTPTLERNISTLPTTRAVAPTGGVPSLFSLLGHKSTLNKQGVKPSDSFTRDATSLGSLGGATGVAGLATPYASRPPRPRSEMQGQNTPQSISDVLELQETKSDVHTDDPSRQSLEKAFSKNLVSLKSVFIEAITELLDEIDLTYKNVAEQALEHIHSGEFILTLGQSNTVLAFLKAAARKRKFTVVVAETAPSLSGRIMAKDLAQAGISTILIPDANVYALMARCSKVVIGPHVVTADGSILATAGSQPICEAAHEMRVPVIVCAGMYKFVPQYVNPADWAIRDLGSPDEILPMNDAAAPPNVINPYYDLVPADLVDLYITNLGGHPPSLLYRLLSDMYI